MKTADVIPLILTGLANVERLRVVYESARAQGREELSDDEVDEIRRSDDRVSDRLQAEIDRQKAGG